MSENSKETAAACVGVLLIKQGLILRPAAGPATAAGNLRYSVTTEETSPSISLILLLDFCTCK